MFHSLKTKSYFAIAVFHFGFFLGAYALYSLWMTSPHQNVPPTFNDHLRWAFWGFGIAYATFFFCAAWIYSSISPWFRRFEFFSNWKTLFWQELPTLLALIPLLFALGKVGKRAWAELKRHHRHDELDLQKFTKILVDLSNQAKDVLEDDGDDQAKSPKKSNRRFKNSAGSKRKAA